MTELLTFGETMLRLSAPVGERLARTETLGVRVGGAESNVAVAAANLGIDAAWLSALPESALGDRIVHALRGEGVEPVVTRTRTGRVGTYYLEPGRRPRSATVQYDREGTPIREVELEDLRTEPIHDADAVHTTGITPALSDRAAATTADLLEAAGTGTLRSFDLNYRAKLWSTDEARATLTDLFPAVDTLFLAQRDARSVLGRSGEPEAVARGLADRHDFETVVLTRGENGALAVHGDSCHERSPPEVETVDPVGSGDALVGGYLARRLQGGSVSAALEYGVATAGLARTVTGDAAVVSPAEVDAVLADEGSGIDR
ncbi:MAG: PfkB family carbohydrate kinase [Salinirussus sp.]